MKAVRCYKNFGQSYFRKIKILALIILISTPSLAEEPQRGRLADGRAFRTDDQGNQLVDYIAELEVNVESLERQVRGLEDENKEKQVIISRLQRGEKAHGTLTEKNIGPDSSNSNTKAQAANMNSDCSDKLKDYEQQIDDLKVDHQVALLQQKKEVASLREQLSQYESQLVSLNEELKNEKSKLNDYESRIARLQKKNDNYQEVSSDSKAASLSNNSRAALRVESSGTNSSSTSTGLRETRIQAVDMLRSKMLTDLNSLQGLVGYRDSLTQEVQRRGASVDAFKYSTSELRQKIGSYRTQINSASKVHELSSIRGSINELRGSVQSEVANLKRLSKSR